MDVIDLAEWKRLRAMEAHPAGTALQPEDDDHRVHRLERAVDRLHSLVSRALGTDGRLERPVETEMLAIMGELTAGLVGEAASRAERLADRLATRKTEPRA